jgi:predicted nucleic acid-binding protein
MIETLSGVRRLYVDANILIYLFEENIAFYERVAVAFGLAQQIGTTLFTNQITITECLNGAHRDKNSQLAKLYLDMFSDQNFITVIPIHLKTCVEAARLGAEQRLKTIDAIHLASSIAVGCDAFLTNDARFRSNEQIRVVQLSRFLTSN